jgi:hypothetical protein
LNEEHLAESVPDGPSEPSSNPDPTPDPKEEALYGAVLRRILRNLWVLTCVLLVPAALRYGWRAAAGFAAGAVASWLSFRSLAQGAEGLADRVVQAHSKERGGVVISRFLLRYLLVGVVGYGIFKSSAEAFRGFLWGLTVPVGAMLIEATYEGYLAWRHPN